MAAAEARSAEAALSAAREELSEQTHQLGVNEEAAADLAGAVAMLEIERNTIALQRRQVAAENSQLQEALAAAELAASRATRTMLASAAAQRAKTLKAVQRQQRRFSQEMKRANSAWRERVEFALHDEVVAAQREQRLAVRQATIAHAKAAAEANWANSTVASQKAELEEMETESRRLKDQCDAYAETIERFEMQLHEASAEAACASAKLDAANRANVQQCEVQQARAMALESRATAAENELRMARDELRNAQDQLKAEEQAMGQLRGELERQQVQMAEQQKQQQQQEQQQRQQQLWEQQSNNGAEHDKAEHARLEAFEAQVEDMLNACLAAPHGPLMMSAPSTPRALWQDRPRPPTSACSGAHADADADVEAGSMEKRQQAMDGDSENNQPAKNGHGHGEVDRSGDFGTSATRSTGSPGEDIRIISCVWSSRARRRPSPASSPSSSPSNVASSSSSSIFQSLDNGTHRRRSQMEDGTRSPTKSSPLTTQRRLAAVVARAELLRKKNRALKQASAALAAQVKSSAEVRERQEAALNDLTKQLDTANATACAKDTALRQQARQVSRVCQPGLAWPGISWHGMAWHGMASHGMAWRACRWVGAKWFAFAVRQCVEWHKIKLSWVVFLRGRILCVFRFVCVEHSALTPQQCRHTTGATSLCRCRWPSWRSRWQRHSNVLWSSVPPPRRLGQSLPRPRNVCTNCGPPSRSNQARWTSCPRCTPR